MFILATRKVLFSKNCKTLRLCIKHFYCKVIRSTQWANPSQQRKGFMATCRFCTPTGGVETLYIIPSSKTKTSLLLSSK